ncbi:MAG: hypothetical protein JNK05_09525 [Myxococcales bacterium]|nr:hypothetical protein [Myxococcales bacterium]
MSGPDGSSDRDAAPGAVLEVAPSGASGPPHPQHANPAGGAVLEVTTSDALASALAHGAQQASPAAPPAEGDARVRAKGAWKKRQEPSEHDALAHKQLALLATDAPILCALWPDLSARDLLTEAKPSPELFARRWSELQASLDEVARKGFEQRNQAAVAQNALDKRKVALARRARERDPSVAESPALDALCDVALDELAAHRDRAFVAWAAGLAGASRKLFAQDLARIEQEASSRGIDRDRSHALLRAEGLDLQEGTARAWTPCAALPGAPTSLDAAGTALLEHPAHAYAAIKRGDMHQWLAANDAPASITDVAAEIRRLADRNASEAHVVHTMAWLFGKTELVLGRAWVRTPSDLGPAVRSGTVSTDDLSRSARDRVLGAWLRRAGFNAAAAAADALGKGEPLGLERLAWALGEPLRVADLAFTDPVTLAQTALSSQSGPALREALTRAYASGELLAWMESLPPSRRDERWIERLRKAKAAQAPDTRSLWAGIYGALGSRATLALKSANGATLELVQVKQLSSTMELASVWDALKGAYRSGELLAWIAAVSPEHDYVDQERPADDDAALNELLWELGHTGLIVEWGKEDQAVTSPEDLVRSYRLDWKWFEAQLRRGYVLRWLERFHGKRLVGGVALEQLIERVRQEMPSLPAGFVALKTALLCGLRQLPLDPCEPGDPATFVGYTGAGAQPASAESWEPLRTHMLWGAGHLWVAQLPNVKATTLPLLMSRAFPTSTDATRDAPDALLKALAATLGAPVPSPALAAKLGRLTNAPVAQPAPPLTPPIAVPSQPHVVPRPLPPPSSSGSSVAGVLGLLVLVAGVAAGLYYASTRRLLPTGTRQSPGQSGADMNTCSLSGAPLELGTGIIVERGIHVNSFMDEVDIAWVHSTGGARASGDGVSWARVRGSGPLDRGSSQSDQLQHAPARDQRRTVFRAFATHGTSVGQGSFVVDQLLSGGSRREVIGCGNYLSALQFAGGRSSVRASALRDPLADATAAGPDYSATFFCRTVGDVTPYILGARGKLDARRQLSSAELFLSTDYGTTSRVLAPWPINATRVTASGSPMDVLREQGPRGAEAAKNGAHQVIAVSGRDRIYAWLLDTTHRSVIDAAMLSNNSAPSVARVAMGTNEALVVWVDRQSGPRGLFAARLGTDGSTAITPLSPIAQPGDEPDEPSVASLSDGGWLISWVQKKTSRAPRAAWMQRYDRTLRALGAPVEVSRGMAVTTARIAHDNVLGFTVAFASTGGTVFAVRGRCQ